MQTTETKRTTAAEGVGVTATVYLLWTKLKEGVDYLKSIGGDITAIDFSLAVPWAQEIATLAAFAFGGLWTYAKFKKPANGKIDGDVDPWQRVRTEIPGERPPPPPEPPKARITPQDYGIDPLDDHGIPSDDTTAKNHFSVAELECNCLLYTSPSPRDRG